METADDTARFEGFSDLPAELRVQIYELHFQDVYKQSPLIGPPAEAPITRASRLLRKESLPVFYDMIRFPFATDPQAHVDFALFGAVKKEAVARRRATKKFQAQAPEATVARIKKLSIDGWLYDDISSFRMYYWAWEIDLPDKGQEIAVRIRTDRSGHYLGPDPGWEKSLFKPTPAQHDRTKEMFHGILDEMADREGEMKLTQKDLKAFAGVFNRFIW